jgi:hypothetical protein
VEIDFDAIQQQNLLFDCVDRSIVANYLAPRRSNLGNPVFSSEVRDSSEIHKVP